MIPCSVPIGFRPIRAVIYAPMDTEVKPEFARTVRLSGPVSVPNGT